jgi:hypothetical protein
MRQILAVLAISAFASHALADDAPAKRTHMSWEARFAEANTAHDGHLTLDEAKAGYKTVARHFHDIDTDGKGYVTENDVRAWHATQKAARHAKEPDDLLRPRPALQRVLPDTRTMTTPTSHTMVLVPESSEHP